MTEEDKQNHEDKQDREDTQEPVEKANEPGPAGDLDQMSEADLRAEIEKHFREQPVGEMLVQFLVTLSNLAYIKMGLTEDTEAVKDLEQASLAIDAFKSLLETTEKRLPDQDAKALAGALSSMQLTFVKARSA